MIYLDKNENPYGPSPLCYDVIRSISAAEISRYDRATDESENISLKLSKLLDVPQDYIYFGYGAEDIIKQVAYTYYKTNSKVLLPKQSWWYYNVIIEEIKASPLWFEMEEEEDEYVYNVSSILSQLKGYSPQIVIIPSPNNPTGNSISYDGLKEILKNAQYSTVILDEAYWGYVEKYENHIKLVEKYPNLVVIRSFSKFFAMAGIRIGVGISSKKVEGWTEFNKRYLGYNRLSQKLVSATLDSIDYYQEITNKIMADKRKYKKELEAIGLKVFVSNANFILVKAPEALIKPLKEAMQANDIVLKFLDSEPFKNKIRISIGTETQNQQVIQVFKEVLSKHNVVDIHSNIKSINK